MVYNVFLELARYSILERIHVGKGSFQTYVDAVESFKCKHLDLMKKYDLTESELFVMFMMITKNFDEIQQQFFPLGRGTTFTKECAHQYDSFLSKVPVSVSPVHYRLERYYKIADFEQMWKFRQTFVCHHYLTVSSSSAIFDKLGDGVRLYINRPIIDKASKAHEVFRVYDGNDEKQINYERNTKFQIDSVNKFKKEVVLTEI